MKQTIVEKKKDGCKGCYFEDKNIERCKELIKEDEDREIKYKKEGLGLPVNAEETYITDIGITILVNLSSELVEPSSLKWHIESITEEYYMTLKELEKQLKEKDYYATFKVIYETPLEGKIYTYGNYSDKKWYLTGKTIGYA